ncbi:MAG: T9SS type A sorting domain-containing protein [Bacteroidota bacterium]
MQRIFYILAIVSTCVYGQAQQRFVITPDMVYNLSGHGNEEVLFDDQQLPDSVACAYPQTDNIWNYFDGVWNGKSFHFPIDVVLDFDTLYSINQICLRKGGALAAIGVTEVYTGGDDPTTWELLFDFQRDSMPCRNLELSTQFLKFRFLEPLSRVREIEVYGPQTNLPTCPPAIASNVDSCGSTLFPMQSFLGANTNFDVPGIKANAVGFIRNYHGVFQNMGFADSTYLPYPNSTYDWWTENPFTGETFHLDRFYQRFKDVGVQVNNVIHRAPPYLVTFDYFTGDPNYDATDAFLDGEVNEQEFIRLTERKPFSEADYPISSDMKIDRPEMYLEYADFFHQFAARYGNNPNAAQLKIADDNPLISGQNTVQYIENWNEPDKWWHRSNVNFLDFLDPNIEEQLGYFSPFEYAAMSSATFDGHGSTDSIENILRLRYPDSLLAGFSPVSLKSADSTMNFVMAGISELNPKYIRAVKFWFDHYRPDLNFPFRAITFHDYSNNGFGRIPLADYGISPEAYGLKERLEQLVEYRNRYLPETEIWLSEFGYDSAPGSIQSPDCRVYCDFCNSPACKEKLLEIQAQWIIRSFMESAAAGIDRAMVFSMRDGSDPDSKGLYQTSGLTTYRLDGFQNKPVWYYMASAKNILKDTKFDPAFEFVSDSVRLYRFVSDCDAPEKEVYAIWSPTSERGDSSLLIEDFELPIQIDSVATLVQLSDGDIDGKKSVLFADESGKIRVGVSERPQFIVLGNLPKDIEGCDCDYIPFTTTGSGNVDALGDEQANIGTPFCDKGNEPQTRWEQFSGDEVIIDLQGKHALESLFLYSDTLATGQVEIYYGSTDNWQLFRTWEVDNASVFRWKVYTNFDTIQTRYVRLKALSDQVLLHEVAFCGQALEFIPEIVSTATTDIQPIDLEVFPNPFSHYFGLSTNGRSQLKITDALGRIVANQTVDGIVRLDSSAWADGIYYLSLLNEVGRLVGYRKIVKMAN